MGRIGWVCGIAFACFTWATPTTGQEVTEAGRTEVLVISAERAAGILARAENDERLLRLAAGARVRALRLVPAQVDKLAPGECPTAEVFAVTYPANQGLRARVNLDTGEVLEAAATPGHSQSSEAERAEAEERLHEHRELAALFSAGARAVGGFVAPPPKDAPPGRYLEYHLASRDGTKILQEAFVDLATGRVLLQAPDRDVAPAGGVAR